MENKVVVFASQYLGNGDDALGEKLMKSFIYTLTQLDQLPNTLLFYNTGAKLASKESAVLEDLHTLEKAGVEVLVCGTCAEYFGIKENLGVGSITNMKRIIEIMQSTDNVIRA